MYRFIQDEIQDRGRPPTNRVIGAAHGITSTGNVEYHPASLERKGYIERVARDQAWLAPANRAREVCEPGGELQEELCIAVRTSWRGHQQTIASCFMGRRG
jgi:SOS-response transcriptional repressor LexA